MTFSERFDVLHVLVIIISSVLTSGFQRNCNILRIGWVNWVFIASVLNGQI